MAAVAPAVAAATAAVRWWMQGSGNVYSDAQHGYYMPDPDLGWRFVEDGPIWLGLDVIVGLVTLALLVAAMGWWLDRRRSAAIGPKVGLWAVGLAALGVPVVAFASGSVPDDAREQRPESSVIAPTEGIRASLPGLPAGEYVVAADPALSTVVATVSAGGEEFETRFADVSGRFSGAPSELSQPFSVKVAADPRTVDTGVELRSKHAQEYLQVEAFDSMDLEFSALEGTTASVDGTVSFTTHASLTFVGDVVPVAVTGTLRVLDPDARARLTLEAPHAIAVHASFSLPVAATKLSAHQGDFSADSIPIRVELVLVYAKPHTSED